MSKVLVIEIFGHRWKSHINIITTILSVWAGGIRTKTVFRFTWRFEENIQANNCKDRRKDNDRVGYWKKMKLSIEWKEGQNTIDEAPTKVAFQKTRKGKNGQQDHPGQHPNANFPCYKIAL